MDKRELALEALRRGMTVAGPNAAVLGVPYEIGRDQFLRLCSIRPGEDARALWDDALDELAAHGMIYEPCLGRIKIL